MKLVNILSSKRYQITVAAVNVATGGSGRGASEFAPEEGPRQVKKLQSTNFICFLLPIT